MADPVHYIGNKPKVGWKTKAIVGAVIIATVATSYVGYTRYISQQEETLGEKIIGLYDKGLEKNLNQFLDKRPDITNKLIRDSLSSLDRSNAKIEPETYIPMFDKIKEKAEENPEIMDHFGPKAQKYAETKIVRKYEEKLEYVLKKGKEKLHETVKDVKENEKIKTIYENIVEGIKTMIRGPKPVKPEESPEGGK